MRRDAKYFTGGLIFHMAYAQLSNNLCDELQKIINGNLHLLPVLRTYKCGTIKSAVVVERRAALGGE